MIWCSPLADGIAYEIASMPGVYCGPAAVAWIAAVWNNSRGRDYDHRARLLDKNVFADGPRLYRRRVPFFAGGLHEALVRETEGELGLSRQTYRRTKSVHRALCESEMPIVLRMAAPRLRQGLHYTALCRSARAQEPSRRFRLQWMDNGLFGSREPEHPAFYETPPLRPWSLFLWGCKRVERLSPKL